MVLLFSFGCCLSCSFKKALHAGNGASIIARHLPVIPGLKKQSSLVAVLPGIQLKCSNFPGRKKGNRKRNGRKGKKKGREGRNEKKEGKRIE